LDIGQGSPKMNIEDEFSLENLLFVERQCRRCLRTFDLIDGFYMTKKDRGNVPSAYAYTCKECTIRRVNKSRKRRVKWSDYPDW